MTRKRGLEFLNMVIGVDLKFENLGARCGRARGWWARRRVILAEINDLLKRLLPRSCLLR